MKISLISVGTEMLMGQTVNTNAVYLSQELNKIGLDVMYHHTVGDNPRRLRDLIDLAYKDCDVVITTGGLGPTQDDLTKEIVTEVLGDHLVLDEAILDDLKQNFKEQGKPFTDNNRKQCLLPSKGITFDNRKGTAPGFALEMDGRIAICMPGPPYEMKDMYVRHVRPYLEAKSGQALRFRDIRCYGIGESRLETELLDLIEGQSNPTLATYAMEDECYLRITAKADSEAEAEAMIDAYMPAVRERIGAYIYSEQGEELIDVTARLLFEQHITVSCAESLTGGLFASTLVSVPGMSAVFDHGLVTYSNRAKMEELGVSEETIARYTEVSYETAKEMAAGVRRVSGSMLGVSCTGVAGPDGGTKQDPPGTAYIGISFGNETYAKRIVTRNLGRNENRHSTMMAMLYEVYRCAKACADAEAPDEGQEKN